MTFLFLSEFGLQARLVMLVTFCHSATSFNNRIFCLRLNNAKANRVTLVKISGIVIKKIKEEVSSELRFMFFFVF